MTAAKLFAISALAYAALVLQVTVARDLNVSGFQPHFLWLAAAVAVFVLEAWPALAAAAAIGFLSDALSVGPLGIDMLCVTLFAMLLQRGAVDRGSPSLIARTALIFAAAIPTLLFSHLARSVALDRSLEISHFTTALGLAAGSALMFWSIAAVSRVLTAVAVSLRTSSTSRRADRWTTASF